MAQQKQINKIIEMGVAQVGLNARDMGHALAALAQESARARVAASAPDAFTDSSGATAASGNALVAIVTPTVAAVDEVVSMAPKAGFDTAIGKIEDAHEEIGSKINEFVALIAPGADDMAAFGEAASADETIAALDLTLTGTTATNAALEDATGIQQIVIARNNQASLASAINWCRVAMGLAPITDNTGGLFTKVVGTDWPAVDQATTAAVAGDGENSLTDATVDAALTALGNNIASMAAALDEMRGALAIGPFVVATNNPHWKFQNADVTV